MVRRDESLDPHEAVVVCGRAALAGPSRRCQARPGFCPGLVKDVLRRLSVGKVLVTGGSLLNVSATCSPPWVHAGHPEAVAVLATGCLLSIDGSTPPKALREAGGVLATHRTRQRGLSH